MAKTKQRNLNFFLRQLERTGNLTLAADQSGLAKSGIHKRKRRDPEFAQRCDEALAIFRSSPGRGGGPPKAVEGARHRHQNSVRPEPAEGLSCPPSEGLTSTPGAMSGFKTAPGSHGPLIPSRYAGKPQLRRLPAGRLTGLGITNFFAALANTGNIRLAARAVGIAASSIHARRRADPAFAEAFEAALALASINVECAIIQAADRTFGGDWAGGVDPDGPRMSVGQMIRALTLMRRHCR